MSDPKKMLIAVIKNELLMSFEKKRKKKRVTHSNLSPFMPL